MNKTIYALGFFDGVHVGHAALLSACRELAAKQNCRSGVVTFDAHPQTLVAGAAPRLINSPADRQRLLTERFAMDTVVILPFDGSMRAMAWQDFLLLLTRDYGAAGFVCGEDFRFGHRGSGNAALLGAWAKEAGLPFRAVPQQLLGGLRVSSTHIRSLLVQGDMAGAVTFLGHPHILTGPVIHGHQLGRRLGFPTANLLLPPELVTPRLGVYACRALVEGVRYPAVTNIGTRPTVSGEGVTVETWLLDYTGDLYGREITLEFYEFLRPERKFPDLEALREGIRRDADRTREILQQIP